VEAETEFFQNHNMFGIPLVDKGDRMANRYSVVRSTWKRRLFF
jgi:hypothetical protein